MADELNRRNFLKAAAIAAGPAVIGARGANDRGLFRVASRQVNRGYVCGQSGVCQNAAAV